MIWNESTIILAIVAVLITVVVYGAVALIVKMDDVGLRMAQSDSESSQRTGRSLVAAMPKVLKTLSVVGTAAMLWVGGHILLVGAEELGWHFPYDAVHDAEYAVAAASARAASAAFRGLTSGRSATAACSTRRCTSRR